MGDIPTMPQFSSLSMTGNSFVESNNANVAGHFGGNVSTIECLVWVGAIMTSV